MKKLLFCVLFCLASLLKVSAQTGKFISADLFSNSLITDLCQDKYGNLWIATDYGLNKYNGYRFVSYFHDETDETSLCHNAVVNLFCDNEGNLWVGTNRGFDRYDSETDAFVHYTFPNDFRPRVSCITQLADGDLFVSTSGFGAYIVGDNHALTPTIDFTPEVDETYYDDVYEDSKGRFWRSSLIDNAVILKADKGFAKFQSTVAGIFAFIERADEVLAIGNKGIMKFSNGQMQDAAIDLGELKGKDVLFNTASSDSEGNIYICTRVSLPY